jgi:tRNA(fMet)-specific endonuclease VapC
MILFDTNILIEIYKNNNDVIDIVKSIGQNQIAISDVTCAELLFGARDKNELNIILKDFESLNVLSIESNISKLSVKLIEKYALSHKISIPDSLIAATAIFYNIELYTLNTKDFKFIDNIKLFEFSKK